MASVRKVKLKKGPEKIYIIQSNKDEAGKTHLNWIPCADEKEAETLMNAVRAAERENRIYEKPKALDAPLPYATVAPDEVMTVKELLETYRQHHMRIGGWEAHTAGNVINITTHYIYPFISHVAIKKVSPFFSNSITTCRTIMLFAHIKAVNPLKSVPEQCVKFIRLFVRRSGLQYSMAFSHTILLRNLNFPRWRSTSAHNGRMRKC